jgi:prophage antirepressor-like protein
MDIVKAFNENNLHTEIVIKGTIDQPLFRASDIGNVLDITNIRTSILDFDDTEKVVHTMNTSGGAQQVSFLTEKGLYKVLFRSRKPLAQKFQNWVCEVIKEIRLKGVYDLQKQLEQHKTEFEQLEEQKKHEYEAKLEKQKVLERQRILLKEYGAIGSIVYIIRVKTYENGQYIVKIGESRKGITARYNEHKSKYEECLLLDCFCVNKSKDFESFIHHYETVRPNRIKDLKGHENENELFLIGKDLSYQMLQNIIQNNINYFNNNDNTKLELEIDKLKLMLEMKNTNNENPIFFEILNIVKTLSNKVDNLEKINKQLLEKTNTSSIKISTGFKESLATLGPRLQKINPENLQIVKVYESATEAMKEDTKIKRPSLNKAVMENTIYNGYRWLFVDRELDKSIIHNIQPTKQTKVQNLGYIAQINSDTTEILNVYLDRKTAAYFNGYQSSSALDNSVKNNTISKGFYYQLYDKCDQKLVNAFVSKLGAAPFLYKNGVGQFDIDNNLVREFACKYDLIRELNISDKTITKSITKNIEYNLFFYKKLESKLKCL